MRFGRSFRSIRNWNFIDVVLVIVILYLCSILVSRRISNHGNKYKGAGDEQRQRADGRGKDHALPNVPPLAAGPAVVQKTSRQLQEEPEDNFLTVARLKKIPDARSTFCKTQKYPKAFEHRISIIMYFYDYQFYDVKTTYASLRHNTPDELIKEIIVVDAGSSIQYILNDVKYFAKHAGKVKILRTEIRESPTRARHFGADHASGSVLVFLDSNAICNKGWIEPLIDAIDNNPSTVAVPHFDFVPDIATNAYVSIKERHVNTFTWGLTTQWMRLDGQDAGSQPYHTPVIRGSVFAIQTTLYKQLGELDDTFTQPGGETLEFSLRTWLCGGELKVIPCSRVGLLDRQDSLPVKSGHNVAKLIKMWLTVPEPLIRHYTNNQVHLDNHQLSHLAVRKAMLSHLKCRDISWYLVKFKEYVVAPKSFETVPSGESHFGYLQVQSGKCWNITAEGIIELIACPVVSYKKHMLFELLPNGMLTVRDQCVTASDGRYVRLMQCNKNNRRQIWKYTSSAELRPGGSFRECAMHVTEPAVQGRDSKRQIIMMQPCPASEKNSKFVQMKFMVN